MAGRALIDKDTNQTGRELSEFTFLRETWNRAGGTTKEIVIRSGLQTPIIPQKVTATSEMY
jgi:hypothetical protein